jgi:hypothetical protein
VRQSPCDVFRMPRIPWVAFILIVSSPLLCFSLWHPEVMPIQVVLIMLALFIVPPLLIWSLVIRDDGITLYRVNRLRWEDVRDARLIRIPLLPHMIVRRRRGFFRAWWVPLHFRGPRGFREVILEGCPKDNPVRRCFESAV